MSVIACRILPDGYEIAADSISLRGWTQRKTKDCKFAKLFQVNDLVIGGVGTSEETALLKLYAATKKPLAANEHSLLEFWEGFIKWKKEKTDKPGSENVYFVGFGGKVFHIVEWFIEEVTKFEAIGAGMDFALAALHLGNDAEMAVNVAIELSAVCESPAIVIRKP